MILKYTASPQTEREIIALLPETVREKVQLRLYLEQVQTPRPVRDYHERE